MNKTKLIQIIERDLEELKMLTEEVALEQNDAPLIIDLAVSKAKLLCQEIELLREFLGPKTVVLTDDEEEKLIDEEENEVSDFSFADPELEIINFEDREFPEEEEEEEEEEVEEVTEDQEEVTEESEEEAEEIQEEDEDENGEENLAEEVENLEEESVEEDENLMDDKDEGEDVEKDKDISEQEDNEEEKATSEPDIQYTELKTGPQSDIREIHIEDLDDDYIEPVKIFPQANSAERPVMREIPKPEGFAQEPVIQEKPVVGESFQKERSLNDVIGDNKQTETTLSNGPITSLRAAIGLNDRFLFIREIFSNNSDKYNLIIDHLDKLETIQEAVEYLKANLTLQKNETSMKFVDLLKRRFTK